MRLDDFYRQLDAVPPPLILLYGQEPFLVEQVVQRIRAVVLGDEKDDFNDHQFSGKGARIDEILDVAQTYPVFAPRRLVTVRSFQDMQAQEQEKLSGYLDQPSPETCLLLLADKIDNRRKIYQQFKKCGIILKCDPLTDREIPDYIRRLLLQRGAKITGEALNLFCSLVSTSLHEIQGEIDKLLLFIGERQQINVSDVETIVSRGRTESVFDLGTAVGSGDLSRALVLVRRFCAAAEPPLLILSLITGHFRLLWKVRSLQSQNTAPAEIARQVGRPNFVVQRLIEQGKGFRRGDFLAAFQLFIEADLAMKSSGADPEALLEQLVIRLIRQKQKPEGKRL